MATTAEIEHDHTSSLRLDVKNSCCWGRLQATEYPTYSVYKILRPKKKNKKPTNTKPPRWSDNRNSTNLLLFPSRILHCCRIFDREKEEARFAGICVKPSFFSHFHFPTLSLTVLLRANPAWHRDTICSFWSKKASEWLCEFYDSREVFFFFLGEVGKGRTEGGIVLMYSHQIKSGSNYWLKYLGKFYFR